MSKRLVIPTAINLLTTVNDSIVANYREGFDAEIVLPSLRARAKMIVDEAGLLPVDDQEVVSDIAVTR